MKAAAFPVMKIFGIVLIVIGVAVLAIVPSTWVWGWWERRDLAEIFEREAAASAVGNQVILDKLSGSDEQEKLMLLSKAFKAKMRSEQPIARLEIPKIGVSTLVVEGTEQSSLLKGPGHLEETAIPGMRGNFAVAGDRVLYGAPFLNLDDLEPGDEIVLETPYGRFTYAVTTSTISVPTDLTSLASNGQEQITLITCDPPWDTSHRLIVQGTATSASLL